MMEKNHQKLKISTLDGSKILSMCSNNIQLRYITNQHMYTSPFKKKKCFEAYSQNTNFGVNSPPNDNVNIISGSRTLFPVFNINSL